VSGDCNYLCIFDVRKIGSEPLCEAECTTYNYLVPKLVAPCAKFSPQSDKVVASIIGGGFFIYNAEDLSKLVAYSYPIEIESVS